MELYVLWFGQKQTPSTSVSVQPVSVPRYAQHAVLSYIFSSNAPHKLLSTTLFLLKLNFQVLRDRCVRGWQFPEAHLAAAPVGDSVFGSGYPGGEHCFSIIKIVVRNLSLAFELFREIALKKY